MTADSQWKRRENAGQRPDGRRGRTEEISPLARVGVTRTRLDNHSAGTTQHNLTDNLNEGGNRNASHTKRKRSGESGHHRRCARRTSGPLQNILKQASVGGFNVESLIQTHILFRAMSAAAGVFASNLTEARAQNAAIRGDAVGYLEAHKQASEELERSVSYIPVLGRAIAHAMHFFSDRADIEEAIKNIKEVEQAVMQSAKASEAGWRKAELAMLRATGAPESAIKQAQAGYEQKDRQKALEVYREAVLKADEGLNQARKGAFSVPGLAFSALWKMEMGHGGIRATMEEAILAQTKYVEAMKKKRDDALREYHNADGAAEAERKANEATVAAGRTQRT